MNRLSKNEVAELVQQFFEQRKVDQRLSIDAIISSFSGQSVSADVVAVARKISEVRKSKASQVDVSTSWLIDNVEFEPSQPWPEVDGYDIVDFLGRGGMGNVYEAYQRSTGRRVAMKFLRDVAISREAMRRRFEREIELVARLQHPAIVSVIDAGHYRDHYFFVMDFIEGELLDSAFPPGRCNVRVVMKAMHEICEAVEYAHQRGVLHRDLKPSNVLIDKEGHPHLVDFGLAKAIDNELPLRREATISSPGQLLGTLSYMSPEQSRGAFGELSVRSDVYSIGVIAYELLTGELPCDMQGPLDEVLHRLNTIPPTKPSQRCRETRSNDALHIIDQSTRPLRCCIGAPADLDAVILMALEKSPRDRYPTVQSLADDIRRFLNCESVQARRASSATRFVRWVRRNRRITTTLVASFLLVVTVIVGAFLRTTFERDRAITAQGIAVRERMNARVAEQAAKHETEVAQTAAAYLAEVYRLLDPGGLRGGRVNAREILEVSLAGTEQLNDQPLGKATVLQAIGVGWKNLGEYELAADVVQRSLLLRQQSPDANDVVVAASLNELGSIHHLKADFRKAEECYRASVALLRSSGDEAVLCRTLTNLGWVLVERSQFVEGEKLIRESLEQQQKFFGPNHADIAMSLNRLGLALNGQRRFVESEAMYLQALAMHKSLLGEEHMLIAHDLENLAGTVAGLQRWEDALDLFRQSLEMRRRVLPDNHPDIARSLHYYGNMLMSMRGAERAKPLFEECVAIRREVLPSDHPYLAQALGLLAKAHMETFDYEKALPLLEESRQILDDQLRIYFPDGDGTEEYREGAEKLGGMAGMALEPQNLAELAEDLGVCLTELGHYERAEAQLESAARGCKQIFGVNHPRTQRAQKRLHELYEKWQPNGKALAKATE